MVEMALDALADATGRDPRRGAQGGDGEQPPGRAVQRPAHAAGGEHRHALPVACMPWRTGSPSCCRLDPALLDTLQAWAGDDLRSLNAQIEFLLRRALQENGRLPRDGSGAAARRTTRDARIDAERVARATSPMLVSSVRNDRAALFRSQTDTPRDHRRSDLRIRAPRARRTGHPDAALRLRPHGPRPVHAPAAPDAAARAAAFPGDRAHRGPADHPAGFRPRRPALLPAVAGADEGRVHRGREEAREQERSRRAVPARDPGDRGQEAERPGDRGRDRLASSTDDPFFTTNGTFDQAKFLQYKLSPQSNYLDRSPQGARDRRLAKLDSMVRKRARRRARRRCAPSGRSATTRCASSCCR